MRFFNQGAPGVEWMPDQPDVTLPIRPRIEVDDAVYPPACPACQGDLDIDGYCLTCGQKAPSLREHFELEPADWVAGVCDIGLTHVRNEDAMATLATGQRAVLVVCDGVTTSEDSDVASLAAARTACDALWTRDPQGTGTPSSRTAAIQAVLTEAVAAANQAVVDATATDSPNAAATTIAIAVIDDQAVHCANLGDSRVYWLPDGGEPRQLTKDHSLAQDGIDSGAGRAEAEASAFAHTITRWLGCDAVDLTPHLATLERDVAGWLVVCTDGLWNYASEAAAILEVLDQVRGDDESPRRVAAGLVAWANQQGGQDNVTVVCARLAAQGEPGSSTETMPTDTPGPADESPRE